MILKFQSTLLLSKIDKTKQLDQNCVRSSRYLIYMRFGHLDGFKLCRDQLTQLLDAEVSSWLKVVITKIANKTKIRPWDRKDFKQNWPELRKNDTVLMFSRSLGVNVIDNLPAKPKLSDQGVFLQQNVCQPTSCVDKIFEKVLHSVNTGFEFFLPDSQN